MAKRKRAVRGLAKVSTEMLAEELRRRRRNLGPLTRLLTAARERVVELEEQVASLGAEVSQAISSAAGRRGGGKRARNEATLVPSLAAVLRGKTMGVTEVAEAVKKAGYKTTSPNFRTIVNQALIKNRDVFKKVKRGQYTAK